MATVLHPWQILVAAMAGWITSQQDAVIDYLREENRVLKEQVGRKRFRLTDAQRRRLAVRGKAIGRRALSEVASLVTPDTILRWHRKLVARKWTYKRRSPGRPRVMEIIADLVLRMARENRRWGYTRIQGALQNVGHRVGRTTISNIFKENGIDPAPERGKKTTWSQFLKAHWNVLAAADLSVIIKNLRYGRLTNQDRKHNHKQTGNVTDSQSHANLRLPSIYREHHDRH